MRKITHTQIVKDLEKFTKLREEDIKVIQIENDTDPEAISENSSVIVQTFNGYFYWLDYFTSKPKYRVHYNIEISKFFKRGDIIKSIRTITDNKLTRIANYQIDYSSTHRTNKIFSTSIMNGNKFIAKVVNEY